jgi:cysteinyl-tRNA synthetase
MQAGARVDSDSYDKQDARDFVLWKATAPGEPTWDFGIGPGRPGWHIECSAMALRLLGAPPIDIHGGGIDLIFPHHENEIAQAEGATGQPFARHWVHVEFLNLDSEKMSKSLGNVFTVRDVLDKGHRASALRLLLLSAHYRKQLSFSWDGLDQAEAALTRLSDFVTRLDGVSGGASHADVIARIVRATAEFGEMIASDLNVPGALGIIFDLVREMNAAMDQRALGEGDAAAVRDAMTAFDRVLGVLALRRAEDAQPPVPEDEILRLVEERREARKARQFARADEIRRDLEARGILLEDGPAGTRWKRK